MGGKDEEATLVFAFAVRRAKKEGTFEEESIVSVGNNSLAETKNTQRGKIMYDLGRFLDSGGYAQVFEACEHKSKERVAIKVIENNKKMSISDLNNEIALHWKMVKPSSPHLSNFSALKTTNLFFSRIPKG